MKRSRIKTDPKKARRQQREWRERSVKRYEQRVAEESESRSRTIEPNRERRKKLYERNFGSHADWIRSLPCDDCGAPPPSDPHHTTSRGAGGDRTDLVPLCRDCHTRRHQDGRASTDEIKQRADHYWTRSPHNDQREETDHA